MNSHAANEPEYFLADSIGDVHELLAEYGSDAKIVAGGQSLVFLLREKLLQPTVLIDVSQVHELSGVTSSSDAVRIGATTTYAELLAHNLCDRYPILREAIQEIGDSQVRQMGTIGGAIGHADPSLDLLPPLLCLDARVRVSSIEGARAESVRDFHEGYMTTTLRPTELIESIEFPAREYSAVSFEKFAPIRGGWAIVTVSVGMVQNPQTGKIDTCRVALGAVADTAVRSLQVEEAMTGARAADLSIPDIANRVAEDIDPLDDHTGPAKYKEQVAVGLVERCINKCLIQLEGD